MPLKIAYIVMRYPTLTQTFIEREMRALAALGVQVEVHPCLDFRRAAAIGLPVPPELTVVRAGSAAGVVLAGIVGAVREIARRPGLAWRGARILSRHRPRHLEGWFHTIWGTLFALARAEEFRRRAPDVIHGTWATAPATVAAVLGELCGRPFSFGAHAYDLHRHGGDPLLAPKLEKARFVHTTTRTNADDLARRFPARRATIVLSRRGLPRLPDLKTRAAGPELKILSVGRLVPKKGHAWQIAACRELARRGLVFRLKIIGEGPLREELETRVAAAGLDAVVELAGECSPEETQAAYAWADVFWHTGIVDAQGDRDGLPNVIPEAFAHGLAVISSAAGGAGEAVINGKTGLLVDPTDARALADALEKLARDEGLRQTLGTEGRAWVETHFLSEVNIRLLEHAFRKAAEREPSPAPFDSTARRSG